MPFAYRYQIAGTEVTHHAADLMEALERSFTHLDSGSAVPISISSDERTQILDYTAILGAWRQQPELQMAALAETYALEIENVKEDFEQKLKMLAESFRRRLTVLSNERDRRKKAYL